MKFYYLPVFKLSLTSPDLIIKWSCRKYSKFLFKGEVTEPLTINLKTQQPYLNGLFCERIFGSVISWKCFCGKTFKTLNFTNKEQLNSEVTICDFCSMEITHNNLRRYRFGYIKLEIPIANTLYFTGGNNILSLILDIPEFELHNLLTYKTLVSIPNLKNTTFNQLNLNKIIYKYTISELLFITTYLYFKLYKYNLLQELSNIKDNLLILNLSNNLKYKLLRKLQIIRLFFFNNLNLSWLFITILPVIPASQRPYTQLNNKTFILDPINELYKIILIKNNRLSRWNKLRSKIPILFEILDKKNLQQSINLLLDRKHIKQNNIYSHKKSKNLTNLTTKFYGKYGLFRHNILGKRVDYSGRSVIIPQPNINLKEVGLPFELGVTLYKPKVLHSIKNNKLSFSYLNSILYSQYKTLNIKYILQNIYNEETVLINRAPTLHRMNIQAFKPTLNEGESIQIYPLTCSGFNADFDGDQMGVFGFLSNSAKREANYLLSSEKNIYSPATGKLLIKPNQSTILGLYSLINFNKFNEVPIICNNLDEVKYLIENKLISISNPIWLKLNYKQYNSKYILTNAGKILINKELF